MEKQVNNKFIQPDPAKMEKVPAQMMIYDGTGWLEISNQQTINDFGKITTDLSTEASKTREYVDRLDEEFKQADNEILKTIEAETTKLDKSITDAKLDSDSINKRIDEINTDSKKIVDQIKENLSDIDKKLNDSQAQSQKAVADLQKEAGEIRANINDQLKNKSVEIAEAKQQAIDNANAALKNFETDVTTKFENANGRISQMVTKTDHDSLAKRVDSNTTQINQNQHAIELKADKTEVDEANTKISDLSSSLTVANDAIKAKAEKTDVDKLAGRVDKAETNLELTSQQIKLKADSSTVNNLTGSVNALKQSALTVDSDKIRGMTSEIERANQRITDTNTLTEQNANTIKTLATKTEINELTQTVSQSKSELNQTIDGIRASVTSVDTKIDSLNIGGTNLLGGTSTEARSNDAPTSGWVEGAVYNTTQPLNESQYILSFEARGDVNGQRIGTFLWHGGLGGRNISKKSTTSLGETFNAVDGQTFVTLTTQWKRYWVLYDVDPDNTKKSVIVGRRWVDSRPSGKIYVRKVKLEKGNKASDWSPAPEDIDNEFTTVNNTLKANKVTLDVLKDGISLNATETSKINDKISNLGVQNLVYNSEFINDAEGWSNIGHNPAGTILFANNEWDSWKGSNGLAFRNPSKRDYLVSDNKRFKVVSGQRLSASVQLHVTGLITHGQCRASMEIKFYANERDPEIATSNQQTQFMYNIENGQQKLLYCENVEVPNNANYAAIRLYTFGVGNIIFNQPMVTFSPERLPYIKDNKMIGSLQDKYASLDVKVNGINSTVATKVDKSYVDQKADEINSVVANKADMSYVNQKADQWQVALQGLSNDANSKIDALSGRITATKNDLTSLYDSETYKGMQKIVQNSAFLQNANGFTTQVQSMMSDELKQINLVYNSEFEPGNGQEIEGWIANHPVKRGTNMYDNYYGSTSLAMWTFDNTTDQWVNAWSQMIDVNEGDHLSASVVAFYTGGIVSTPLGICGIEIELFEREGVSRKTWASSYEDIVNIPWGHEKTIRIDDYTIPSGITKARIGLVIEGKGNVMFAHPMLVKGTRAGIYQPSVVNKLSKLTQTLDGLKSEVHDGSINSVIGQTARMIALQISGDKNKVISQINASTEGIMIDGKHIMINGNTRIQGTLMVNDVVMKSQNNAVKFSPESLDMIGSNSMLKLQSDSIRLGSVSSDPRQQWGVGLDKNGLAFTIPVKRSGATTNNPSDYRQEIQGYINGGGWDYTKVDTVGNGASGIEIGLMTEQTWGAPYGGDYIAIGQYTPTNTAKTSKAFSPAISYSETGFGWAPRDIHMYKPTTFHSEMHMNVPSTGYGIRTAWVSWSDWNNEKYPCFVNDTGNWGGIAFPSNGNVVMFNSAGMRFNIYETNKDKHYNGYGGN